MFEGFRLEVRSKPSTWYDPLEVWDEWADDVRGGALPCGHYLPEEARQQTTEELLRFFAS